MKKAALWAGILVLATMTACSVNMAAPTEPAESAPIASSASSSAASESEPTSIASSKSDENSRSSVPKPASESEAPPSGRQADNGTTQTASPPSQPQQQTPPPTEATPPQPPTPPQAEQPIQAPAPEPPVLPSAPKTAYDAPYDTGVITADASAYGASLGMTWSESLNTGNCSWEAPITTSPDLSGERLRSAIQSGINRVLRIQQDNGYQVGEFHFKVSLEANGAGEYTIYFLMG